MGMMLRRRNADENGNITTSKTIHADDKENKAESEKDEPKTVKRGRKPNH
jgi:hypothetical protein